MNSRFISINTTAVSCWAIHTSIITLQKIIQGRELTKNKYSCNSSKTISPVYYIFLQYSSVFLTGFPLNILFEIPWLFTDFSLAFDRFLDPFERPILAIFIHQQFENFIQIFMLADLIFKETSQTIHIRKGMFLNTACLRIIWAPKWYIKTYGKLYTCLYIFTLISVCLNSPI